jgi:L-serine/L-threonine ammonia-lyase
MIVFFLRSVYMPPFDHADVWKGNSTMIPEIKAQLGDIVPDAIVCSVGGGGLINGIILGLQEAGWNNGMCRHHPL